MLEKLMIGVQLVFTCVIGMYFLLQLKSQTTTKANIYTESSRKLEKMRALRAISLTEPLSERLRPKEEKDIIGQEEG